MIPNDDLSACAGIVQKGDPDRFLATMAAPVGARGILFPLFALNVEIARAPYASEETVIAEMRLQWWRDAIEEIANDGPGRRHEVVTPLAAILDREIAASLDEMIAVRRWDIYKDPFEDRAHFDHYIDQTAATLMWTGARLLGPAEEEVVRQVGYAAGVAGFLRGIPAFEARNRIPLLDGTAEGVRQLASDALAKLKSAQKRRRCISPAASVALFPAWQSEAILKQAITSPADVTNGALGQSEARKRFALFARSLSGRW